MPDRPPPRKRHRRRIRRPVFVDMRGVGWVRVITDERYEWRRVVA